ncbi:TatD family hydrolase [Cupriavidus basilensis]
MLRTIRLSSQPDMHLIDIGVNFHSSQIAPHTDTILERAVAAGVVAILATGTSLDASRKASDLARLHPRLLFATAGTHPHTARDWSPSVRQSLESLWERPEVVAIGECGLDYNRNFSTPADQRKAFADQLEAAVLWKKPLFLHCRDAFEDFYAMVEPAVRAGAHGVVHCFTGAADEAAAFVELGLDIGITGWVTDLKRGQALREAVQAIPLDRLHLETDAPYLGPKNHKNRRPYNEPANLPWIAQAVAELKALTVAEVASQCTRNSRRLFGIPA